MHLKGNFSFLSIPLLFFSLLFVSLLVCSTLFTSIFSSIIRSIISIIIYFLFPPSTSLSPSPSLLSPYSSIYLPLLLQSSYRFLCHNQELYRNYFPYFIPVNAILISVFLSCEEKSILISFPHISFNTSLMYHFNIFSNLFE